MKTITIDGKEYEIDCNALTYVKYKNKFKTGIIQDMHIIENYLIKQTIVSKKYEDNKDMTEEEKMLQISNYMIDDIDEFVVKITQLTWILIYSANSNIEEYELWLKSIKKLNISDEWIAEVAELAVECFC